MKDKLRIGMQLLSDLELVRTTFVLTNSRSDSSCIGMQLLSDLELVRTKVVPCFPPHYNVLQFFITQYAIVANNNVGLFDFFE